MKIVKEHINEIRQDINHSGLGAIGSGRVAIMRQKYKDLYVGMEECRWDFWTIMSGPNILSKESARILNCNAEDIVAIQFDGTCIQKKTKELFGSYVDEFAKKDRFINFRFYIWDEPKFILSYNADDWNNYSSKITMYINNKVAKFFIPSK